MQITAETRYKHGELYHALDTVGWTIQTLSSHSGVSVGTLSGVLNLRRRPSEKTAHHIEKAFLHEASVEIDMLKDWSPKFKGFKKPFKVVQTRDVPTMSILEMQYECKQLVEPEEAKSIDIEYMLSMVKQLPERSQMVVNMYYLEGKDIIECSRAIFKTRERVRQILDESLEILKLACGAYSLTEVLFEDVELDTNFIYNDKLYIKLSDYGGKTVDLSSRCHDRIGKYTKVKISVHNLVKAKSRINQMFSAKQFKEAKLL